MSERAVPFHCPYCGEEDLWPHEVVDPEDPEGETSSPHGAWECRGCRRAFQLAHLGLLRPSSGAGMGGPR